MGAIGVSLACYGLVVKTRAEALLKDLTSLTIGRSTEADAQRFAQRHSGLLASRHCNDAGCTTSFQIRNSWLAAARLEPESEFDASYTVDNGMVTRIGAMLVRAMPSYPSFSGSAGIVNQSVEFPSRWGGVGHYLFRTPVGKPYLKAELDSQASAVQRSHAFAFSFRCLAKPGWGCDLPCDYLPLPWQDWKADLEGSGFPMSDFDKSYRNNARCPLA